MVHEELQKVDSRPGTGEKEEDQDPDAINQADDDDKEIV